MGTTADRGARQGIPSWIKIAAGVLFSAGLLALAARKVDFGEAWKTLSTIDVPTYLASLAFYFGTMIVRACIIVSLLAPQGRVTLKNALGNLILGYFCNNVLPLKVGEVIRSGLVTREAGMSFWTGLSALVMERSMDIAAIIVIAIVTSAFLPLPPQVTVPMQALGAALLLGWATLVALAIARRRGWKGIERLASRLPDRARPWVDGAIDRLAAGLKAFSSPLAAIRVVAFVALFWIVALVGWYLRLSAFGLASSPVDAGFVILVVGLGVSIPSMPAYVGVLQACIVFALGALGVPASRSFPFAVFIHAVDFAFVGVLGLGIMLGKSMTIGKLRAAARPDDAGPEAR